MIPAAFDYFVPQTLEDALSALAAHGEDAKILAGGHSLLPLMKLRLANPKLLVDLRKIPGLGDVRQEGDKIIIGALTTHYQIESSALIRKKCPLLSETARTIGDVQVRNRGTIGGSLSHADPAADWPAAVLALEGEIKVVGPKGERRLAAGDFFRGPMTSAMEATDILTEIHVPAFATRCGGAYAKMAQQASGFAVVGAAVWLRLNSKGSCEEVGVGVTGLSEKPFRAHAVEQRLRGNKLTAKLIQEASALVAENIEPLEDLHAAADYRAHLARVYTSRAIHDAAKRAAGKKR
ncbi:MAG: xanthine dehydrogenase family protein subunit M [Deltaproteobacteria bacterium]|nr:xanthine dehydrogenase family protein subunit M [Deltaproteobacteria bacterium]